MEEMKNLRDLLKHELEDLYSAEEQMIDSLPKMIEKAGNADLKNALNDHLRVTKSQKARLDKVKSLLGEEAAEEDKGFFAKLFSGQEKHHCVAMEGLIKEGEELMGGNMEPEVRDVAIIAAAQKIEHYEIGSYGTAKAFALHLGLTRVANFLDQTLKEEYGTDNLLTDLAIGEINAQAMDEEAVEGLRKLPGGRSEKRAKTPSSRSSSAGKSSATKTSNGRKSSSAKSSSAKPKTSSRRSSPRAKSSKSSSRSKSGSSRSRGR